MSKFSRTVKEVMESFSKEGEPCLFEQYFTEALREDAAELLTEDSPFTTRIDKLGNKVKIPPGYSYKEGPDGYGIAVPPCAKTEVDKRGRLHAIPKGYTLKIGKNGSGLVVPIGAATRATKEGQIELIKKPKKL